MEKVAVLESVKMEMRVVAASGGEAREIPCTPGPAVSEGDALAVVE